MERTSKANWVTVIKPKLKLPKWWIISKERVSRSKTHSVETSTALFSLRRGTSTLSVMEVEEVTSS